MAEKQKKVGYDFSRAATPARARNNELIRAAVAANPGGNFDDVFRAVWDPVRGRGGHTNGETAGRLRIHGWLGELVRKGEIIEKKVDGQKKFYPAKK